MILERISLMEAYIIETLRSSGVTEEELIKVNNSSIKQWKINHETFDFTLLKSLAENKEAYESIVKDGYKIKFLTFNGLINLLHLKFSKLPEKDFDKLEEGIEKMMVTEEELAILQGMLSPNWMIVPANEAKTISIKQTSSM